MEAEGEADVWKFSKSVKIESMHDTSEMSVRNNEVIQVLILFSFFPCFHSMLNIGSCIALVVLACPKNANIDVCHSSAALE